MVLVYLLSVIGYRFVVLVSASLAQASVFVCLLHTFVLSLHFQPCLVCHLKLGTAALTRCLHRCNVI